LRDHLLPAIAVKGAIAEVGRGAGARIAVEPHIRLRADTHQERACHLRGRADAQIGLAPQQLPGVAATADGAGIDGKRCKAFVGQVRGQGQGAGLFLEQQDLVQRHSQVGVEALFGGVQIAPCIQLVGGH